MQMHKNHSKEGWSLLHRDQDESHKDPVPPPDVEDDEPVLLEM